MNAYPLLHLDALARLAKTPTAECAICGQPDDYFLRPDYPAHHLCAARAKRGLPTPRPGRVHCSCVVCDNKPVIADPLKYAEAAYARKAAR